jgi:hypothetical protein
MAQRPYVSTFRKGEGWRLRNRRVQSQWRARRQLPKPSPGNLNPIPRYRTRFTFTHPVLSNYRDDAYPRRWCTIQFRLRTALPVPPKNAARAPRRPPQSDSSSGYSMAQGPVLGCAQTNPSDPRCTERTPCSGSAKILMVKPTKNSLRADLTNRLDLTRQWRVPIQRLMRSRLVVVLDILTQDSQQEPPTKWNDMIGAFATERTDGSFYKGDLPWRARR